MGLPVQTRLEIPSSNWCFRKRGFSPLQEVAPPGRTCAPAKGCDYSASHRKFWRWTASLPCFTKADVEASLGTASVRCASLLLVGTVFLASCASRPLVVATASPCATPDLRSVGTVLLLEPQRRIVDLRGRETSQAYQSASLTQELLLTAAAESLLARQPAVPTVGPQAEQWPLEEAAQLRSWSDRSLQVTRGGRLDPGEIGALLDGLGLPGNTAVLFSSLDARLGDDGYDVVPLMWSGQAQTHMTVLRTALFFRDSAVPAWTNTLLLRASPAADSPELRQAVRQLFLPLQR